MKKTAVSYLIISIFLLFITPINGAIPESKQATIIDASSSTEVIIEATGIYTSPEKRKRRKRKDIRKNGIERASLDARKAALYFLLYSGTDPLLSTEEEKQAFESIQSTFFTSETISKFITYEDALPKSKTLLNKDTAVRIVKQVKINRELLKKHLETSKILTPKEDILDIIGNPTIMVIPRPPKDSTPLTFLEENQTAKHGAGVIEALLTARQYNIIIPQQQASVSELSKSLYSHHNESIDLAYQLALSIGSDIYIDYEITSAEGEFETTKYSVAIRAFETTTGRLLGAETGYSQARKGDKYVSIEESMLEAINNVMNRVLNYWKNDLKKGIQYKVIVQINQENLSSNEIETIQDALFDSIESVSKKSKENIVTNKTLDYILWCDPLVYTKSRLVWRQIQSEFKTNNTTGKLSLLNLPVIVCEPALICANSMIPSSVPLLASNILPVIFA